MENIGALFAMGLIDKDIAAVGGTVADIAAAVAVEFAAEFVAGFVIGQDIVASAAENHLTAAENLCLSPWADMTSF